MKKILVSILFGLISCHSGYSEPCGIENCHGLEIACGPNIPEVCTESYMLGDRCRQYASCKVIDGKCQQIKSEKFQQCRSCVQNCSKDFKNDVLKLWACESRCGYENAGENPIKARVDKVTITTDDNITYELVITSTEKKISQLELSKFEGFDVISQAQSSSISFVEGKTKTVLEYAFVLAPKDTGKLKIAPSKVKIQGKTYSTDSFEIEVTQGKIKPKTTLPESEEPQITL